MGILTSVTTAAINAVDQVLLRYSRLTKGRLVDYCPFDTPLDETTLVTDKASLISFIDIGGTLGVMGDSEFITAARALEVLLNGILATPGHSVQWVFSRSPSQTEAELTRLFAPLRASAVRQGFDASMMESIFTERMDTLTKSVVAEECLLAFMTHPAALSNIEKKEQANARQHDSKKKTLLAHKVPLKMGEYAQSVTKSLSRLSEAHRAALTGFVSALTIKPVNIEATVLDCHHALRRIRQQIQPALTASDWIPVLPGDPVPLRVRPWVNGERDHIFYPVIATQLFSQTAKIIGHTVNSGEQFETTIIMSLPPQEPRRFDALFAAIPNTIDWRYSLHCLGGDTIFAGKLRTRRSMAKIFRVGNSDYNEAIIKGCDNLLYLRGEGEMLGGVRLQITVRATSLEKVRQQSQLVARMLQSWGNCDTSVERGDPFDALVATLPGMDSKSTGETLIQPVRESTLVMPITRPASPWQDGGTELYATLDGKPYPMQACSSLQQTWVTLYYGPPGSGKSLSMNARNYNLCLTPGLSQLPRIAILDIGSSSEGLILLLQALLPEARKGEVVHKTLKQDKSSAINPLDTLLGMRFPHASKRGFIKSFLLLLFTADGEKKIKEGIGELVGEIIDETYKHYSDDHQPKHYTPHTEPVIDSLLHENPDWFYSGSDVKTKRGDKLTWWRVTDVLAEKGLYKEAGLAQRHAVPLISDLTGILHGTQAISDVYAKNEVDKQVLHHLTKMIRSAITDYPILAHPTQFNVGEARVVALDLADVTGSGSQYDRKKTGLMYMLGREVTLGSLYFDDDDVKALPPVYKAYHERRINQSLGDIKRVCMDEYHRTDEIEAIVSQTEQDIREARKYKVELVLGSQRFKDYTETMITLATNIYICNGAAGTELEDMAKTFALGPSEKDLLRHKVHGAGKDGATFMLRCETKKGRFTQVLVNRLGVIELWALTSTAEDRLVRKQLLQQVPYFQALTLLASEFPEGSCKPVVEARVKKGNVSTEQVVEHIVTKLVTQFQQGEIK